MLNECAVKGHAPVGHPLSMASQIKSWNSFTVWCPCDRARCLAGSLELDLRSDSGKQQLADHFEVRSHMLSNILLSIVLWFAGGFSIMGLDQHKSGDHSALSEGKDHLKDDHARVSVDALSHAGAADWLKKAQA